jgi:hypothetical protein
MENRVSAALFNCDSSHSGWSTCFAWSSASFSATAFGRSPCRGIAEHVHAEKENMRGHRSKRQDRKTTLPSTIAVVRGSLAYGEVFPDAAPRTSVWLPYDAEFSLGKAGRNLSARF